MNQDRSSECKCPCHTGKTRHFVECSCYTGKPVLEPASDGSFKHDISEKSN